MRDRPVPHRQPDRSAGIAWAAARNVGREVGTGAARHSGEMGELIQSMGWVRQDRGQSHPMRGASPFSKLQGSVLRGCLPFPFERRRSIGQEIAGEILEPSGEVFVVIGAMEPEGAAQGKRRE